LKTLNVKVFFTALEKGIFGDVKRPKNGGKGLDGVAAKGANYYNLHSLENLKSKMIRLPLSFSIFNSQFSIAFQH